MKRHIGRLALITVAIIWGSGFVASSLALNYFSPNQILALRFTLAFVACLIVYYKDLKNITKKEIKYGSIIGVFLFLAFMFQTVGLQYTTASKNAFLTAVNVIIVPFLAWIISGEKIQKRTWLGLIVSLIGIALLSVDFSNITNILTFNLGDLLTLICALFFALQIFYTNHYVRDAKASSIMIAQMGTAAVLSWIFTIATGETSFNLNADSILPIIYLGLVSTMVAYGLQTWAQQYTTSTEAALILSTEAFFGALASMIILGDRFTVEMVIGAMLIFVGIIIVELSPDENTPLDIN